MIFGWSTAGKTYYQSVKDNRKTMQLVIKY